MKYPLSLLTCLLVCVFSLSQKSKDGAETYSSAGTVILNRYTSLASNAASGTYSVSVSNIANLSGATSFTNSVNPYSTNALTAGDLVLIIQVQGANIRTTDNSSYGNITAYNNTGNYEIKSVDSISGNIIFFCIPLLNSYTQGGRERTQVIRIPRLSSLTVGAGVTLSGQPWAGTSGGIVALEVNGNITVNGAISATGIGFRGGVDPFPATSSGVGATQISYYRASSATTSSAGKGEGIAGTTADYDALLNGSNGRGAPANGGGGGNGHNCGGGGGANAGSNGALTPWNGTGIKNTSTPSWATAWNLESFAFASNISMGGGRGGHSYCLSDQNALVVPPGNSAWGGDYLDPFGGFGGRPLDYNGNTLLFIGGGGGAGDGNNNDAGAGGNGGGIIYILCNGNIGGAGFITANGDNGVSNISGEDGAGGGGGGGAINILADGSITGISISANGGNGGNHGHHVPTNQVDGPGGGGGGGYIAATTTSVTRTVNGGANGISLSPIISEFPPAGATQGNSGTIVTKLFLDVTDCVSVLPARLINVSAIVNDKDVTLQWKAAGEINVSHYIVQKSTDNRNFYDIGVIHYRNTGNSFNIYSHSDYNAFNLSSVLYYRILQADIDGNKYFSKTLVITFTGKQDHEIGIMPNPVTSASTVTIQMLHRADAELQIIDVNGKIVHRRRLQLSKGQNNILMSTDLSLPPGCYTLLLVADGIKRQKKFIKQ